MERPAVRISGPVLDARSEHPGGASPRDAESLRPCGIELRYICVRNGTARLDTQANLVRGAGKPFQSTFAVDGRAAENRHVSISHGHERVHPTARSKRTGHSQRKRAFAINQRPQE